MNINIFGQTTKMITGNEKNEETSYGYTGKPITANGIALLGKDGKYSSLLEKSDSELLNIMWGIDGLGALNIVGSGDLKRVLETHYRRNNGKILNVIMPNSYWVSSRINDRRGILSKIREKTQKAVYDAKRRNDFVCNVDCSYILDQIKLDFRADPANPSLAIPMGGVQGVKVRSKSVTSRTATVLGMRDPIKQHYNVDNIYEITLEIILRDWFAVDEDDFAFSSYSSGWAATKSFITKLGREALTAFWILQHQRGYRPFVWNAIFESKIHIFKP